MAKFVYYFWKWTFILGETKREKWTLILERMEYNIIKLFHVKETDFLSFNKELSSFI